MIEKRLESLFLYSHSQQGNEAARNKESDAGRSHDLQPVKNVSLSLFQ